ncbi:MAG: hypothetical protein IJ218_00835 [Alphaproteobacteria bacterium]|nr:hypothetical protein [Alphaproteobacteria bacterium]
MSGICAFFGHRDTDITPKLEEKITQTVRELITYGIDEFWCCEQGNFDWICRLILFGLKKEYQYRFIRVCCVCAYNPNKYSQIRQKSLLQMYDELIYTEKIAAGHPRFAITRRNRYIAKNANIIICYITRKSGGAHKAVEYAKTMGAKIINLAVC